MFCRPIPRVPQLLFAGLLLTCSDGLGEQPRSKNPGPTSSGGPDFFPIAVWMQDPALAARYKEAGINTYVALANGPTEEQLAELNRAGMRVICHQNEVGLDHVADPTIVGWMHEDEPDLAKKGGRPAIPPWKIIADYKKIRAADPSRPVFVNFGPGVTTASPTGTGENAPPGHIQNYREYIKGGDIVSFDIYPVASGKPDQAPKLWQPSLGVERLVEWSEGGKEVWNCLECTGINNINRKPTPHEMRSEAWTSIIHGSRGLIWFVHELKPALRPAALLDDKEMLAAVTAINRQIGELAPAINSPEVSGAASVKSEGAPVALMVRKHGGALHLFAAGMRDEAARATFQVEGNPAAVEVIGENRTIPVSGGVFEDSFEPWDVHLYRIPAAQ